MTQDYYSILGVPRTADAKAIKAAYRRLALEYHPDRHNGKPTQSGAEEQFKRVSEAYEILSDPDKKANYDRYGTVTPPVARTRTGPFTGFDVDDIFARVAVDFGYENFFRDFGGFGRRVHTVTEPELDAMAREGNLERLLQVCANPNQPEEIRISAGNKLLERVNDVDVLVIIIQRPDLPGEIATKVRQKILDAIAKLDNPDKLAKILDAGTSTDLLSFTRRDRLPTEIKEAVEDKLVDVIKNKKDYRFNSKWLLAIAADMCYRNDLRIAAGMKAIENAGEDPDKLVKVLAADFDGRVMRGGCLPEEVKRAAENKLKEIIEKPDRRFNPDWLLQISLCSWAYDLRIAAGMKAIENAGDDVGKLTKILDADFDGRVMRGGCLPEEVKRAAQEKHAQALKEREEGVNMAAVKAANTVEALLEILGKKSLRLEVWTVAENKLHELIKNPDTKVDLDTLLNIAVGTLSVNNRTAAAVRAVKEASDEANLRKIINIDKTRPLPSIITEAAKRKLDELKSRSGTDGLVTNPAFESRPIGGGSTKGPVKMRLK